MSEELTKAAQQALEAWQRAKYPQPQQDPAIAYAMQMVERALTVAQPAQNERELPEPSDIGEVGLLRAELAGLNACVGHLSAMVDEQTRLVQKAAQIMKALHESATPDDGPDMDAIIPGVKFSEFVDGHAELLFALAHGPQVTTIKVHGSLTDEQIEPMFRARKATPSQGEKDAWYWYAWGVNDCERRAALQSAQPAARDIAEAIHYPDCWDQMAYPTLESALHELTAWFKCANDECQQRAAVSDAEMFAAIRPLCMDDMTAHGLVKTSADEYRAIEAHHGITAQAKGGE